MKGFDDIAKNFSPSDLFKDLPPPDFHFFVPQDQSYTSYFLSLDAETSRFS